ncbi:MAG TPA: hypothetical protein VM534_05665 [Thermoanaerobaculia bacterium]|nr:hypothetical protein [Thermoanaerobaculia bacterium]
MSRRAFLLGFAALTLFGTLAGAEPFASSPQLPPDSIEPGSPYQFLAIAALLILVVAGTIDMVRGEIERLRSLRH